MKEGKKMAVYCVGQIQNKGFLLLLTEKGKLSTNIYIQ